MEGETRAVSDNSGLINAQPISILVVDDDTTCLAIVAAKLKRFQYHVVTVKHPDEALCTLRIKGDAFNLVVSDVHMPEMNGIQLQQVIAREFNLPVVLMSADKKADIVLEGLQSGAAFYIAKPVSTDDIKDLWQFAVSKKKKSNVVIEETGCFTHEIINSSNKTSSSDEVGVTASSMNEIAGSTSFVNEVSHDHNKDSKRKSLQREKSSGKSGEISETASQKKQKVVWTNSLHNRFLEAIRSIGFDRAVPKKILEVMNVPSLTRENVASHLQKYRIFLRRVADDANLKLQCSDKHSSSRTFSPIFTPASRSFSSSLFLNNLTRMHNPYPEKNLRAKNVFFLNREGSTSDIPGQPRYGQLRLLSNGGSMLHPNPETFLGAKNAFFLNQEGSSSDVLGQTRFGQLRLPSNGEIMLNPNAVCTNRTTDNESTRLVQNIYQNITPVQGNISRALSPHIDPPVLDSTTGLDLDIADYGFSNSYIPDGTINPTLNSLSSTMSKDCATSTNFVGLNISNIQQLLTKSAGKQPASDGRINNLASDLEFQNSTTVGIGLSPNESSAINVDEMVGDQLWDDFLAEECQTLMHSNAYNVMGNVENRPGESTYDQSAAYSYSPMFDLDELVNLPLDQECNPNPNVPPSLNPNIPTSTEAIVNIQDIDNVSSFDRVVNVQNQVQDIDNVSLFDQALNEREEDDFLESLLAPGLDLYEENPNIEGL